MNPFFRDTFANAAGSIIGGVILAAIFFASSDYLFKPPDLNGRWLMATRTEQSTHTNFIGLTVIYEIMLHKQGDRLSGTAEMIADISSSGITVYENQKRVHVELDGSLDRKYFSRDRVNIRWLQHGRLRDSSSFFRITRFDDTYMSGTMESTSASSKGLSEWARVPGKFTFVPSDGIRLLEHNYEEQVLNQDVDEGL